MKIIKEPQEDQPIAVTLRLPKHLVVRVTQVAEKNRISRQKLVSAILTQALDDKDFRVRVKG